MPWARCPGWTITESCPPGGDRGLTAGERALAAMMFGPALDVSAVRICRRRWWWLQRRRVTMAPMGHIHFHPDSPAWCDDFSAAPLALQAHFIHELTHCWQAQRRGRWYLPFRRHPFCRYRYQLVPGKRLTAYGIEQQAEIMAHAFLARMGQPPPKGVDPDLLAQVAAIPPS